MLYGTEFRRFKAQLLKRWATDGFTVASNALVRELETVVQTITIRKDKVDQLDVGLWIKPKGLPPHLYEDMRTPGVISVHIDTRPFEPHTLPFIEILQDPEIWPDFQTALYERRVLPELLLFSTANQCAAEIKAKHPATAATREYREYIGMRISKAVWTWGPAEGPPERVN